MKTTLKRWIIFWLALFSPGAMASLGDVPVKTFNLEAGAGNWYSDSFRSSFAFGGGVDIRLGQWFEIGATYDRALLKADSTHPLSGAVGDLHLGKLSVGYLTPVQLLFGAGEVYAMAGYLLAANGEISHGLVMGGGLNLYPDFMKRWAGLRFELRNMFYAVPYPGGTSEAQKDQQLLVRVYVPVL